MSRYRIRPHAASFGMDARKPPHDRVSRQTDEGTFASSNIPPPNAEEAITGRSRT